MADTTSRKFYRLYGLSDIFETYVINDITYYNTSVDGFLTSFSQEYLGKIDAHTILFITANPTDAGRKVVIRSQYKEYETDDDYQEHEFDRVLDEGDTMIWIRGALYGVSTNAVVGVAFDSDTQELVITFKDGTTSRISNGVLGLTAVHPIYIDSDNQIGVKGFYFDDDSNFVENQDNNSALAGVKNTHVEGVGNRSTADFQHIQGKYAKTDKNSIFIIGGGTKNNPYNLFVVGFDGVAHAISDITAGDENDQDNYYKLSDIHSVIDEDWVLGGDAFSENSFDNTDYDDSYN